MVELQREINISTIQWDFKKPFIINLLFIDQTAKNN